MKKIALFVTAIAVSLSLGGKALADTNTATFADKAGITPDNTILYHMDKVIDNLKISIASGDDKKAETLVDVAEERLGESEVMADKEKTDLSNQAFTEYTDKITEAQDKVADAIDKTSNSTTDSAIKSDELEGLETTIANRQIKSIEVLKNIENKASGTFKGTLSLVIEMQTRKKEAIVAVAKERQILLHYKKAVKEAEDNVSQAKKAGDEQAIKTAEDILTQAQQTLTIENEKFNQVVAAKKEAMKGGVGELKKQAEKKQAEKEQDIKTNDATSSTNNTTSEDKSTSSTTSSESTTDTNTINTDNITDTTTQGIINNNTTVTNDTKTDVTVKENKGQKIKTDKKNNIKGNNSENENKVKH